MGMVPVMAGSQASSQTEMRACLETLRGAAARTLRHRPVDSIIDTLDRVTTNWLGADNDLQRRAEAELPGVTGFSAAMIRHGLPRLLQPLSAGHIGKLLDAELGDRRVLDRACAGRALGPPLIVHVLSGNIPGLAAVPVLLTLALKSAVLIKPAAGDPLFPQLLAASIAAIDAELGQCVLVAPWRGGDTEVEAIVFREADLVVASGSDAAIAAVQARVARRFIGHGHKISFAVIGRECLADDAAAQRLARHLAYDVSLWDQQGCLSPQLCYIESGGNVAPAQFAPMLAHALGVYAEQLPPRRLTFDEQAAVQAFRQEAEWCNAESADVLASPGSTDWTVSVEPDARFRPSCLSRCLRLKVVRNLAALATELPPHRRHLEAAGVAVGAARAAEVGEMLAASGVHRLCPIGTMQLPPLTWRQSGRPRVADWVEWTMEDRDE